VASATPSLAVQMVGLNSVPTAGDEFYVCEDETTARKAAELAEDTQVPCRHTHNVQVQVQVQGFACALVCSMEQGVWGARASREGW